MLGTAPLLGQYLGAALVALFLSTLWGMNIPYIMFIAALFAAITALVNISRAKGQKD